jgi:general secretion pathway protein A
MFEKPLGLRENPFLAGHHPKYLFPSREHQEALAHLRYGIQNREPFVLITGEVGTGKTTAVYDALAEWGSRAVVALITNSALSRSELLEEICLRFGVSLPSPVSKPQALVELQRQLTAIRERGELAILLVDEAQNLDRELLEEIRLLSNLEVGGEYLLQIFLVGQPELETKLAQKELRQLRQRIGIHYRILPLSNTEGARYIHHRVSVAGGNAEELFPAATCAEIYRITNGIPREINVVAGQSLLNAFVDDARSVTVEHVRAVEKETSSRAC